MLKVTPRPLRVSSSGSLSTQGLQHRLCLPRWRRRSNRQRHRAGRSPGGDWIEDLDIPHGFSIASHDVSGATMTRSIKLRPSRPGLRRDGVYEPLGPERYAERSWFVGASPTAGRSDSSLPARTPLCSPRHPSRRGRLGPRAATLAGAIGPPHDSSLPLRLPLTDVLPHRSISSQTRADSTRPSMLSGGKTCAISTGSRPTHSLMSSCASTQTSGWFSAAM